MNTQTIIDKYLNEFFVKTDNLKDILTLACIWKCMCQHPIFLKKTIPKKKDIGEYLKTLPNAVYSPRQHSIILRGWRLKLTEDEEV
jgi:hypothetical protein